MKNLLRLLVLCSSASLHAASLQSLTTAELGTLNNQYHGQNHALMYWSLSCVPCRQELTELGELAQGKKLPISFINTGDDSPEQIQAFLTKNSLGQQNHWLFADPIPERLRQAIDSNWFGELPRSYLVDAKGQQQGISGSLDIPLLLEWFNEAQ